MDKVTGSLGEPYQVSPADVRLIAGSGLFDATFYAQASRRMGLPANALIRHYLQNWATCSIEPSRHFDGRRYQNLYLSGQPGWPPLLHYLKHGMFEGLNPWSEDSVRAWQQPLSRSPSLAVEVLSGDDWRWPVLRVGDVIHIHVHRKSHIVFHEFRELLAAAFRYLGVHVVHADETVTGHPALRLIIAPHDFLFIDPHLTDGLADQVGLSDCVLLNTEQIYSVWFGKALRYLKAARCVADLNLQTAACLKELGISSRFLPLGFIPDYPLFSEALALEPEVSDLAAVGYAHGSGSGGDARPIDLLWIGSNSKRRQRFLDGNYPTLDEFKSFIRLVNVRGALSGEHPEAISSMNYAALAQRSKILLNVHHFDVPYFEWQRLVHFGLFQQACVVTETVSGVDGLVAGEHYFEADLNQLPELVKWLLHDVDGIVARQSVAVQGCKAAREKFQLIGTLRDCFSVI